MSDFIRLDNVAIGHGSLTLFNQLSLTIPASTRVLAICGASGCGKTTLLRTLVGLHAPATGIVEVLGSPVRGTSQSLTFLSQSLGLYPWKSVRENVEFGLLCQGIGAAQRRQSALEVLERLGLLQWADVAIHKLSTGMQQRIALARAVIVKPDCVFLDEPFSALDYRTTTDLCVLLSQLAALESRYVVVTHDIRAAAFLADTVLLVGRTGTVSMLHLHDLPQSRPVDFFLNVTHHRAMGYLIEQIEQDERPMAVN